MPHRESIAIIPARGGSRGIPRKNLQPLQGVPLLAYSILIARACTRISRVVVSTDDEDIAATARQFGADVPFMRPACIAGDRANICDAIPHALETLKGQEGYDPEVVAVMYPTHPFRSLTLLDGLLARIEQGHQAVITVRPIALRQANLHVRDACGRLRPLRPASSTPSSQPQRPYGLFAAHSTRAAPLGTYVHQLNAGEELIDIDVEADLELARAVVAAGVYRLGEA